MSTSSDTVFILNPAIPQYSSTLDTFSHPRNSHLNLHCYPIPFPSHIYLFLLSFTHFALFLTPILPLLFVQQLCLSWMDTPPMPLLPHSPYPLLMQPSSLDGHFGFANPHTSHDALSTVHTPGAHSYIQAPIPTKHLCDPSCP